MTKTHWLQNPNKNYLWHQDLPNWEDIILTIKSWEWEEVKNPVVNTTEIKRVIRFQEKVKPFICNETNAETIMKVTQTKYIEDAIWKQIQLYVSQTKVKREMVDCIRIKETLPQPKIDNTNALKLLNECKTYEELWKVFLWLSNLEKADKEVIILKDNLKATLWKN